MEILRRLLVGLLGMIDEVVYYLIEVIYGLLMDIARATPFNNEIFSDFANRIYVLLGLFMVFKVAFSLIKYIVNPDEFNDKVKGGKKLVINILVVLVLIVVTPMAFDILRDVQETLLEERVMEKIILGTGVNGQPVDQNKIGAQVKVAVFSSFYRPDDAVCGASDPANTTQFVADCSSFMNANAAQVYSEAYIAGSVNDMIHKEVNGEPIFMQKRTTGDGYAIHYMFIVSTVAGIFTAWIFLTFCIDIAIRTVKLGFLQLISPVPIISYIDPSSSKSGMFNKWIKEVGKTYADLFIRLGAVYFAITLIAALMQNGDLGTTNFFARVFIILGILIFANQIPKLLGDLLGIKIDGNFSLNPMRKINSSPIAAAAVGGATGLVGGMLANTASLPGRLKDFKKAMDKEDEDGNKAGFMGALTDGNKFRKVNEDGSTSFDFQGSRRAIGSMLRHAGSPFTGAAGGASAMLRGMVNGSSGKGSAFGAGFKGVEAASRARNARGGGYTSYDKVKDKFTDMAGLRSKTGTTSDIGDRIKANQQQIANYKRDEQSYSQQLADLARFDPSAYGQAFAETTKMDANGDVVRDKDGKIVTERSYEDYRSYFASLAPDVDDTAVETRASYIMQERGYSSDAAGEARAMREAMEEIAHERGLITEKQFNDYASVLKARDDADEAARKLEKRNKELQGYLDAKSGKPKQ
ncbi:MAG: hypothetical protein HFH08_01585 [Bacilli bacterium]|nr:hypothetical protein [Bacilli bacterium]